MSKHDRIRLEVPRPLGSDTQPTIFVSVVALEGIAGAIRAAQRNKWSLKVMV